MISALLLLASAGSARAQEDAFTFVVVGDTQTDGNHSSINWDVFPQIVEDMNAHDPAFGLFVGDLVGGASSVQATAVQWEDFKSATAVFGGEVYPIPGNHDVYGGAGTFDAFADTFDWLPQDNNPPGEEGVSYTFDYGNTRVIGITSDQEVGTSAQVSSGGMTWLSEVLADSEDMDHVFVFTHHPVTFSDSNYHGGTTGDFWQNLVAYGVTGLFSGHWHRYQPSQPGAGGDTWETIIGTGGGWTGFSPTREYQQRWGYLVVEVEGASAIASFWGDEDGDGYYDDKLDEYTMAWENEAPKGLVARYTFDEGAVADSAPGPVGRGIDGTLEEGAEITLSGISGHGMRLDGENDYAVASGIADYALSINGDLTLSLWAKPNTLNTGTWPNALLVYATADYYSEDEETNYSYWLNIEGDHSLRTFWEYGSGTNVSVYSTESANIHPGDWQHYAVTREAEAMEVRFYLDGALVGEPVSFETLPTGGGRGMLYMGSDTIEYGTTSNYHGSLDEICIYNEVLEGEEILALAELADCTAFNEAPQDTGEPEDTGETGDTGETEDTETSEPTDKPGVGPTGCGCSSQAQKEARFGLWMLLGLGLCRLRRSAPLDLAWSRSR